MHLPGPIKARLISLLSPHGVRAFMASLPPSSRVVDLGCGNNGPFKAKSQRPDLHYIGIDVAEYHQSAPNLADDYRIVPPAGFAAEIEGLKGSLDAVISSHNIEHCDEPDRVLAAMVAALRPGGRLYLSFPSEASLRFPKRGGCLNFHDDPTHRDMPSFDAIERQLRERGCEVVVRHSLYKPGPLWLLGGLLEPLSRLLGRTLPGTWAWYGFESVLWLRRPA